jgi:hypothetical protein
MTDTPMSEQERREAKVVSGHLPSGYSAEPNVLSDDHGNAAASASDLMQPGQESPLKLLGGDIYRDLYKINARAKLHQRAATFSHLSLAHLGLPLRARMVKWPQPNNELLVAFAGSIPGGNKDASIGS